MIDPLVNAIKAYAEGTIDWPALKKTSAGFGIYRQKNGNFMMRLRRTGGFTTPSDLQTLAKLMSKWNVPRLHLTTRQDYQLHDVSADQLNDILAYCCEHNFPFLGGGGDTFRNVYLQPAIDATPESVFPVRPIALALANAFKDVQKAYQLPRKLKIAFADRASDNGRLLVATNDLGFLAVNNGGAPAFEVWIGGGLGNRPKLGLKVFEALPVEHCIKVAIALTNLFHARGNREQRAQARIRFLRDQLGGDDAFIAEFMSEYEKTLDAPQAPTPELCTHANLEWKPANEWQQLAVTKDRSSNLCSVRLFVPNGDFTAQQIKRLAEWIQKLNISDLQLLPSQDLLLLNVPTEDLPAIQATLLNEFADIDLTLQSFVGHIITCVGNTVCLAGAGNPIPVARALALDLDKLFSDVPDLKQRYARILATDLRISGCPNSCGAHQTALLGFFCCIKNGVQGVIPYTHAKNEPLQLGTVRPSDFVPEDHIAQYVIQQLKAFE